MLGLLLRQSCSHWPPSLPAASLFSTAAAIAETPVIRTGSHFAAGRCREALSSKVRNISASSEIAASSGLNATGSAIHRGPAAALRCHFFRQQLAGRHQGSVRRNRRDIRVRGRGCQQAQRFGQILIARRRLFRLRRLWRARPQTGPLQLFGLQLFDVQLFGVRFFGLGFQTLRSNCFRRARSPRPLALSICGDGFGWLPFNLFFGLVRRRCSTALAAEANIGSSSLSTGAGSCASRAVFTATHRSRRFGMLVFRNARVAGARFRADVFRPPPDRQLPQQFRPPAPRVDRNFDCALAFNG